MTSNAKLSELKPTIIRCTPEAPTGDKLLEFLPELLRAYTIHHKHLEIEGAQLSSSIAITVRCDQDDNGRLLGSGAANLWALQTICKFIGRRMQRHVHISLLPPAVGRKGKARNFEPDADFDHEPTTAMLKRVLAMAIPRPFDIAISEFGVITEYEIRPSDMDRLWVRGDLTAAVENIFHATGKVRGRIIHVVCEGDASMKPRAMTVAPPKPPNRGQRVLSSDELEADARAKGGAT